MVRPVPQRVLPGWGSGSQEKMAAPRSLNTILRKMFRFNQDCLRRNQEGRLAVIFVHAI
jgi:hypothetical protein